MRRRCQVRSLSSAWTILMEGREESLVLEVYKPLETHSVLRDSGDQPGSEVGARAGHIQAENRTQTTVLPWKEVSSRFLQQGLSTGNFPSFILLKTPISKRFFKTMHLLLCLQFKINGIFFLTLCRDFPLPYGFHFCSCDTCCQSYCCSCKVSLAPLRCSLSLVCCGFAEL